MLDVCSQCSKSNISYPPVLVNQTDYFTTALTCDFEENEIRCF